MPDCQIEVNIRAASVADLAEQLERLLAGFAPAHSMPAEPPIVDGVAEPEPETPTEGEAEPQEEPAPRRRRRKPADASADTDSTTPDPAAGGVTFEELRGLLTQVQAKRKLAGVIELLASTANERRLSDVAPEHYPAVAEAARKILAEEGVEA